MRKVFSFLLCCIMLNLPFTVQAQPKGFILMAGTIGPLNTGIAAALEDRPKVTGKDTTKFVKLLDDPE